MELQLVSKEVAILAKELGFDWDCWRIYVKDDTLKEGILTWRLLYYENDDFCNNTNIDKNNIYFENSLEKILCTAPEQELLAKWLRDVYQIYCYIHKYENNTRNIFGASIIWEKLKDEDLQEEFKDTDFKNTWEEAMDDALITSLRLISKYNLAKP